MLENQKGIYADPFNTTQMKMQQLRLARLRQQRSRMQNMKEAVEKYSAIIKELQKRNNYMSIQIEHYKLKQKIQSQLLRQKQQLIQTNSGLKLQLENERILRINLQNTIKQLKEDISILSSGLGKQFSYNHQDNYQTILIQYQTLQELYQGVKNQLYIMNRENLQLKNVIYQQSKNYSQHQQFWKEHSKIKQNKENNGNKSKRVIQMNSKINIDSFKSKDKQKIKQLQSQIKKFELLVQKFKATDEQQRQLIQMLKKHDSKVCICHSHGIIKTSQKIILDKDKSQQSQKKL